MRFKLFSFQDNMRTLHLGWMAFLISFIVWFNHAPLMASIRETLDLTEQQVKTLLILNVALTIPARILIGMLVDRFGPRIMYSLLLVISSVLCFFFALADSFEQLALARFLLGFVGAGFVIGIRLIGEWFPARQVGLAEGIYAGWGNFGSAAAAITLPTLALWCGGAQGWRYAIGLTGVIALIYAAIFYRLARDTPKGSTYFKPKKMGAMEVTSKGDLALYILMNIPMYAALGVLAWKLSPAGLGMLSTALTRYIYIGLAALLAYNVYKIIRINQELLSKPVPALHRYKFKQVAVLNLAYLVTFGSELAVVSMLPLFFKDTYHLSQVQAGLVASVFAVMVLIARPVGGLLSDRFGRKRTLSAIILGLALGYFAMSRIDTGWPLPLAVLVTLACSLFVHTGNGAVFAIVPLIKRRLTGQIAGMTGAYGNVGGVLFLTVLSFVSPSTFFLVIACTGVVCLGAVQILDEPSGQMAEVLPDGTVQLIDVT